MTDQSMKRFVGLYQSQLINIEYHRSGLGIGSNTTKTANKTILTLQRFLIASSSLVSFKVKVNGVIFFSLNLSAKLHHCEISL